MGVERRVTVGHQRGGVAGGIGQRFALQHAIGKVDHQMHGDAQIFAHTQIFVVAKVVGDFVATGMANRARAGPTGQVIDHIGPIDVIDVAAAGKAEDGDFHLADAL